MMENNFELYNENQQLKIVKEMTLIKERDRIASDIHDELTGDLTGLKYLATPIPVHDRSQLVFLLC